MPRFLLLLIPSLSSFSVSALVALVILGASGWSYVYDNLLFYDQLFGIYGFKTMLLQSDSLGSLQHLVFDGPLTYHILLLAAGITIGVIVYTILETARHTITDTVEEIHDIQDDNPLHKAASHEALARLLLRIASIVGWGIYVVVFMSLILPFCVVTVQTGIDLFEESISSSVLYCIGATILLSVGIHTHIVFARLCLLRPRLFGDADIEAAEHRRVPWR